MALLLNATPEGPRRAEIPADEDILESLCLPKGREDCVEQRVFQHEMTPANFPKIVLLGTLAKPGQPSVRIPTRAMIGSGKKKIFAFTAFDRVVLFPHTAAGNIRDFTVEESETLAARISLIQTFRTL